MFGYRARPLMAVLMFATVLSAVPAAAATAFTSNTVISASGPAHLRLVLENEATVDVRQDPQDQSRLRGVDIEGGSGLSALLLTPAGDSRFVQVVKLPEGDGRAADITSLGPGACKQCVLAPGVYDVFVVTEHPVTFTLAVAGAPDGVTEVQASEPLNGRTLDATHHVEYGGGLVQGGNAHAGAGWYDTLTSAGGRGSYHTFAAFWFSGVTTADVPHPEAVINTGVASPCRYADPASTVLLFQPGCAGGSTSGAQTIVVNQGPADIRGLTWHAQSNVASTTVASGGIVAYDGVRDVDAAGYWFELP